MQCAPAVTKLWPTIIFFLFDVLANDYSQLNSLLQASETNLLFAAYATFPDLPKVILATPANPFLLCFVLATVIQGSVACE
jgi:hypothetical protein